MVGLSMNNIETYIYLDTIFPAVASSALQRSSSTKVSANLDRSCLEISRSASSLI